MGYYTEDIYGAAVEENVLFYPSGEVNVPRLEEILTEAHERRRKPSDKLLCISHQREKDFDEDNPTYEDVVGRKTFRSLSMLYKRLRGHSFEPKKGETYIRHEMPTVFYNSQTGSLQIIDIGG